MDSSGTELSPFAWVGDGSRSRGGVVPVLLVELPYSSRLTAPGGGLQVSASAGLATVPDRTRTGTARTAAHRRRTRRTRTTLPPRKLSALRARRAQPRASTPRYEGMCTDLQCTSPASLPRPTRSPGGTRCSAAAGGDPVQRQASSAGDGLEARGPRDVQPGIPALSRVGDPERARAVQDVPDVQAASGTADRPVAGGVDELVRQQGAVGAPVPEHVRVEHRA